MANRTNTFTAADGAAWPASSPSGSWTHTSDPASGGTGVSRTVQGNRGRIQWSTTGSGTANASHLDRANFTPVSFDMQVTATRTNVAITPAFLVRTSGTGAGADCYRLIAQWQGGKGTAVTIDKRVSSTVTTLSGTVANHSESFTADNTAVATIACRVVQRTSDVWLCLKAWSTGSEPPWPAIGSTGYASNNQVVAVLDSTSGLWNATGGVALYSLWASSVTSTSSIRWDDVAVRDLAVADLTIGGIGTLTATATQLRAGAANLTGAGTLTGTGQITTRGAAALTGIGTLTATGSGGTTITDAETAAALRQRWTCRLADPTWDLRGTSNTIGAEPADATWTGRTATRWTATPKRS